MEFGLHGSGSGDLEGGMAALAEAVTALRSTS